MDSGGESSGDSSPSINASISSPTGTSNTAAAVGTVSVNSGGTTVVGSVAGVGGGNSSASPSAYIGLAAKAAAVFENMVFKTGVGNAISRSAGNALGVFADITNTGGPGERLGAKIGGAVGGIIGTYYGGAVGGLIGNTAGGVLGGLVGRAFDNPHAGELN